MPFAAPYLLSLCEAAQESRFTFGVATRLGDRSSTFKIDSTKLIHSVVTFSPARESVAIEFLQEFQKVVGISNQSNPPLMGVCSPLTDGTSVEPVLSVQPSL
jgi:hypothetical protein